MGFFDGIAHAIGDIGNAIGSTVNQIVSDPVGSVVGAGNFVAQGAIGIGEATVNTVVRDKILRSATGQMDTNRAATLDRLLNTGDYFRSVASTTAEADMWDQLAGEWDEDDVRRDKARIRQNTQKQTLVSAFGGTFGGAGVKVVDDDSSLGDRALGALTFLVAPTGVGALADVAINVGFDEAVRKGEGDISKQGLTADYIKDVLTKGYDEAKIREDLRGYTPASFSYTLGDWANDRSADANKSYAEVYAAKAAAAARVEFDRKLDAERERVAAEAKVRAAAGESRQLSRTRRVASYPREDVIPSLPHPASPLPPATGEYIDVVSEVRSAEEVTNMTDKNTSDSDLDRMYQLARMKMPMGWKAPELKVSRSEALLTWCFDHPIITASIIGGAVLAIRLGGRLG